MGAGNAGSKSARIAQQQYDLALKQREEAQALANSKRTNALYSFQGKTSRVGFGDIGSIKKKNTTSDATIGMGSSNSLGSSMLGLVDINRNKLGG